MNGPSSFDSHPFHLSAATKLCRYLTEMPSESASTCLLSSVSNRNRVLASNEAQQIALISKASIQLPRFKLC
jgi:hypothetical protein